MLSGISKQQVVRCASLSVSAHQHQSTPNMTIADKQTQITCYIEVRVNFQVKAHQSLCIQHTDMFRIAAVFCLLETLMHPVLSLQALHAQVDPTCMVTLGWWWLIPDHWFTQRSPTTPQWSVQDNNRHINSIQNPMSTIRFCMHVPETLWERHQSPGKNIKY